MAAFGTDGKGRADVDVEADAREGRKGEGKTERRLKTHSLAAMPLRY